MKLNISYPSQGTQKVIEIDDENQLRVFMDKRMSDQVDGGEVDPQFKGYIFTITGGNDKQGFPMKQGILTTQRVKLLFSKGHSCFRERRKGQRKRKSVRGCIVSPEIAVLNLVIMKKGEEDLPGLTDDSKPRRLGPKRASKIRKLFQLEKDKKYGWKGVEIGRYVVRRDFTTKEGKKRHRAPKIQRLVTAVTLQRRRRRRALKRKKWKNAQQAAKDYKVLLKAKRG